MPYFAMAFAAAALIWEGSRLKTKAPEQYRKIIVAISYVLAGFIFCFFAGARDHSVGADIGTYAIPAFNLALESSFADFFLTGPYRTWNPLMKVVFWCSANWTHSFFWYLFAIELCFTVPTLIAIKLLLNDDDYKGVFIFGILFFPLSLNLMRQAAAMGFVLLASVFVRKRKPLLFMLIIIIAALFHDSAFAALLIYPLYLFGYWNKSNLPIKMTIMAAAVALAMIAMPTMFSLIGPYLGHYSSYVDGTFDDSPGMLKISLALTALFIALGSMYYYCLRKSDPAAKRSPELSGIALVVFSGILFIAFGFLSAPNYRPGLYFTMLAVILVPMAIARIRGRREKLMFTTASFIGLCACFFGFYIMAWGIQRVLPYALA